MEKLLSKLKDAAYRLSAFSEIASKRKEDVLSKAIFEEAAAVNLLKLNLEQIGQSVKDYHYALDMRQHGGAAQDKAFNKICQILNLNWEQGKERALQESKSKGE